MPEDEEIPGLSYVRDTTTPVEAESPTPPEPSVEELRSQLDEERRRSSGILNELRATRGESQEVKKRLDMLAQGWSEWHAAQEARSVPPPSEDPLIRIEQANQALAARIDQLQRDVHDARGQFVEQNVRDTATRQFERVIESANASGVAFAKEQPDYPQALQYLANDMRQFLSKTRSDPNEVEAALAQETLRFIVASAQSGQDPARAAYELAKERGYQAQNTTRDERGRFVARPTGPANPPPMSLGNRGGTSRTRMDIKAIMKEDPKEFAKIANDPDLWARYISQME